MDDYKKCLDINKSAYQAFEQFNKIYGVFDDSILRLAEEAAKRESEMRNLITPFYDSYQDILSSMQPAIDEINDLNLSVHSLDFINQANSNLSSLFEDRENILELMENASSINQHWQSAIHSINEPLLDMSASQIALHSHFDDIAHMSLLAQERLLHTPWNNFNDNIFNNISDFSVAVDSFNDLTRSYETLCESFAKNEKLIIDCPPFVSGIPPVEILTGVDLLDSLSRNIVDIDQGEEEADAVEIEIHEDIEASLDDLLDHVNPEIKKLWRGAKHAFSSNNPDKHRHVVVSLREMLTHILHTIAPDNEVKKWTSDPSHYHEGRPTRESRLLYLCRDINHGPFRQFMNIDVEAQLKFIRLFQRGTHELSINFTEQQVRTLIIRTESLVRFLLISWRAIE